MKTALLCVVVAASTPLAIEARAAGGFPAGYPPPYPYPSYCPQCWPNPEIVPPVIIRHPDVHHRTRVRPANETPK